MPHIVICSQWISIAPSSLFVLLVSVLSSNHSFWTGKALCTSKFLHLWELNSEVLLHFSFEKILFVKFVLWSTTNLVGGVCRKRPSQLTFECFWFLWGQI